MKIFLGETKLIVLSLKQVRLKEWLLNWDTLFHHLYDKNVYKSLRVPQLTYELIVWGNASQNFLDKVVVLQKRVLRLINFIDRKEHTIALFVNATILPITILYYEAVCKLMLDVHNDSAPSNTMKLFARMSNTHIYTTRS